MLMRALQQELNEIARQGLYRSWQKVEAIEGGRIQLEGRWFIHLASNSYLGLHQHSAVMGAAREALDRFGTGVGSARLLAGTSLLHEELEEELARFKGTEAALVFSTGYMANLGIVTALVGRGDLILADRLNHASLIDAARLSGATLRVFPHADADRLGAILKRRPKNGKVLVMTEGVFSMDGDLAPLKEIVELTRRHGAWLLVDDAHGTGVVGPHARGTLEHFGISGAENILQMGTLSKALGSLGGYLAAPRVVIETLKNKARPFIYTTALPAACAAAALEALRVIDREPVWHRRLWENVSRWTSGLKGLGLDLISEASPIVPIRISATNRGGSAKSFGGGSSQEVMALAKALFEAGLYAPGIRPPTVPAGSARIRTSVTALHAPEELETALELFRDVWSRTKSKRPQAEVIHGR